MKNEGKKFEQDIQKSLQIYCLPYFRLKDDGYKYKNVVNPCDYIVYAYPNLILLELKSTKGKLFDVGGKIKAHQIEKLQKFSYHMGIIPAFVFNFREQQETYVVLIEDFLKITQNKKSINIEDCRQIGFKLPQQLKRTRYSYNIKEGIEWMKKHKR